MKNAPAPAKAILINQLGRSSLGNKVRLTISTWKQLNPKAKFKILLATISSCTGLPKANMVNPKAE